MSKLYKVMTSIIIMFFVGLMIFTLYYDYPEIYHYFFSTGGPKYSHHFQWIGITVVFTGLGLFLNERQKRIDYEATQRKRDADNHEDRQRLKAKSSIEWMSEFRQLIAEFSTVSLEAQEATREYGLFRIFKRPEKEKLEQLLKAISLKAKLEKTHRLLNLYTPRSDTTAELQNIIEEVFNKSKNNISEIENSSKQVVSKKKEKEEFTEMFDDVYRESKQLNDTMITLARDYLDHEWQQAIGELTGDSK